MKKLLRAHVFHTPGNPFLTDRALQSFWDGGVAIEDGRIAATGSFATLRRRYPGREVMDLRPGILLPGLVDTHVHYSQVRSIGAMGLRLMAWLERHILPTESRMSDPEVAGKMAQEFLRGILRNGTTCCLAFGAHFQEAQEVFFREAARSGMHVTSGMILSDQNLEPALRQSPSQAYESSRALIERWHGRGRIRYAVTPRFAVSTSPEMLDVARTLLGEKPGLVLQTHLNETLDEIAAVKSRFPWAADYLEVYEAFDLVGPHSVFAHDIHPTAAEIKRLAQAHASVAHCPTSNAFLGSGLFPMAAHHAHHVDVALGSDVGAGTGFSLFKEGLMAYQVQMLRPDGFPLGPVHLLYLCTLAGARAMGVDAEVGDLTPGKWADMVLIKPLPESTLGLVLSHSDSAEAALGALFTLAGEESVSEVYVAGSLAYRRAYCTMEDGP